MKWEEVLELEPKLAEVEAWARTVVNPDDEFFEEHYTELKHRLNPLVGWHRIIPGYERVPYTHPQDYTNLGEMARHDEECGNNERKQTFFQKIPLHLRVLYNSEAWDAALKHLVAII